MSTKQGYSVKVFEPHGGARNEWFASRLERAMWLIEHGYGPEHVLSYSNPENDPGDVFDVPKGK